MKSNWFPEIEELSFKGWIYSGGLEGRDGKCHSALGLIMLGKESVGLVIIVFNEKPSGSPFKMSFACSVDGRFMCLAATSFRFGHIRPMRAHRSAGPHGVTKTVAVAA